MPLSNGSYDPETLAVLTRAFDDACKEQHVEGVDHEASQAARMLMAMRIMTAAARGELDPERLKLEAIHSVEGRGTIDGGSPPGVEH
jgi:hypothetical protein